MMSPDGYIAPQLSQNAGMLGIRHLWFSPDPIPIAYNVPAVADARESQRAGVPKGEPPQAAKRQPSCYTPADWPS